jgi:signal recognition particle subunit SRP54
MTPEERRNPKIINGSRRARIANGSGVAVGEVSQLVTNFFEGQKQMKAMFSGGMPGMPGDGRDGPPARPASPPAPRRARRSRPAAATRGVRPRSRAASAPRARTTRAVSRRAAPARRAAWGPGASAGWADCPKASRRAWPTAWPTCRPA